jgi:phosphoadenylyl-sulfate reductase (thioredoxin)
MVFMIMDTELDALEAAGPVAILRWAAQRFAPDLVFATGFGVEGCVLIDLVVRHRLPVDLMTLDTGVLFPETYVLWRALETRYGVSIQAVRPAQTLEEQAQTHGAELWKHNPQACCQLRKVEPLERAVKGKRAWISAIRREQTPGRTGARAVEWDSKFSLVKINPLVCWTGRDVWQHVHQFQVPYNPLHDQGYPSIGCAPCTTPVGVGEDPRAGRWRGQGRNECGIHQGTGLPVVNEFKES